MQVLAGELIRLAHHVSGGPDAAPFAAALRAALAIVQPGEPVALDRLIEHLTCAREHADFLRSITELPPPWRQA